MVSIVDGVRLSAAVVMSSFGWDMVVVLMGGGAVLSAAGIAPSVALSSVMLFKEGVDWAEIPPIEEQKTLGKSKVRLPSE